MLPLTVELVNVSVPRLAMPPPPKPALLPLTVELVSVAAPVLKMPPPLSRKAWLSLTVESVSVSVPELKSPPPVNAVWLRGDSEGLVADALERQVLVDRRGPETGAIEDEHVIGCRCVDGLLQPPRPEGVCSFETMQGGRPAEFAAATVQNAAISPSANAAANHLPFMTTRLLSRRWRAARCCGSARPAHRLLYGRATLEYTAQEALDASIRGAGAVSISVGAST
jgi:hypothetical protein